MYWFGFNEAELALDPKALARVETKDVKSDEPDPVETPDPDKESAEDEELDPEIGAQAKLIVLGTPGWMGMTLAEAVDKPPATVK